MKAFKTVLYSFFLGGLFALIAQAILTVWQVVLADTPLAFFIGGATLVSMGVIGCILGGKAIYQYLEHKATFGSLLPFSGFAMAVGMKMLGPWFKGENLGKSVWQGAWLVIWFNAVGAVVCILFGFACTKAGVMPVLAPKTTGAMLFPAAYFMGGVLCAFFQCCWLLYEKVAPNSAKHVWVLMFAWMCGAILAPFGISGSLANVFGEGFSVMIPVGGLNMYNVGMDLALGGEHVMEGLVHLGSFLLAVFGLFFTGLATFPIYNKKFGRTPVPEVHAQMAKEFLNE